MPENPLSLPIARPHNNQMLFSDSYLDALLPKRPHWALLLEEAGRLRSAVATVFGRFTPSANEAQTERDLVRPILEALGHDFEMQPTLASPYGTKRPDYVFYRDGAALTASKGRTLDDGLPALGGFAVGEAKQWDRPLDTTLRQRGGDPFSNKNPSYQIAFYMQHSGVEWGVLTNGRLWRLYHKESAHKLDRFYEVDLPALLEAEPEAFLYFFLFFRRTAFDEQPVGVAAILRESVEYARSVGDSLKSQVYDALLHLAQGFLDYPSDGLATDPASLRAVYDNSLIVLYRLLFVLYAEDRDLLPVREQGMYRETYSLFAIKRAVAHDLAIGRHLLPTSARLWPQLRDLFQIIDRGSPPLRVGTFNGGLFDPARHPFLEQCTIGDAHLQQAIDKLARVKGQFVDYRDLSVRHLGTIYEGLLENHLEAGTLYPQIAQMNADSMRLSPQISQITHIEDSEPQGRDAFSPPHPLTPSPAHPAKLRLVSDKGERKATGSYYTPDFIVKYIVEQTVGPVLAEAIAGRVDDASRVEAVLGVNVLDPAMGSGHFLVEATEYIARFLVDLDVAVEDSAASGPAPSAGTAAQAGGPPRGGHVGTEDARRDDEGDLAYWKRRVAQSCIYGVDLNPLAVELAKLSLWLITIARDRPLSFLDHHLRTGNALVGARLDDLEVGSGRRAGSAGRKAGAGRQAKLEAAGQISMLSDDAFQASMSVAVGNMWLIEGSESRTVAQVKQQEALYAGLRESFTGKYGRLADLVTATHFGVSADPALWKPLADFATGRTLTTLPEIAAKLRQADAIAAERRFFHWELEFPEVFFDRHGRPLGADAGFDAVIGNPPYVRQEQLAPFKPYLEASYAAFHGAADLYLYFFERGLKLARRGGRMAYISSGTFARANFATAFRKLLPTLAQMETLIDFGENQPFEGAEMVRPSIVVLRRGEQTAPFRSLFIANRVPESLSDALAEDGVECAAEALAQPEWTFQAASSTLLFVKILAAGRKLVDVVEGKMYYGVKTGLNEAFIIDQATRDRLVASDPASAEIVKPVLRGEDLRPWYQEDEGRWLIVLPSGWTRATFGPGIGAEAAWAQFRGRHPGVADHLAQFADTAEKRWDKGEYWWELRSCDYYTAFNGPKIFWPDICKLPRFSSDVSGKFVNDKGFIISTTDPYLLGVLQTRVTWFSVSQLCVPLRLRAGLWQYQMKSQFVSRLPIPDAPPAEREVIAALAMAITEQACARYALHRKARHRLLTDFGTPGKGLNQKLTAWWDLDFTGLRAELQKVFKRDVPVSERDDWETWLAERKAEHRTRTAEIVRLETELNARVYALFGLTAAEIEVVEESTKYRYGEV